MKSAIAFSLAFLSSAILKSVAAETGTTVTVVWADGGESPGVCVEKENWFISVIPATVALESLKTVALRGPDATVESRILHLDTEQRLCLIEASPGLGETRIVALSSDETPKAGEHAECISGKSTCLTTVAGKDWAYRGKRFPLPLLRLRVSEAGPHCRAGTPLVGENGELMAILTGQELEASGEVYAIPVARVRKMIEDVKRHKRSGPVWVGLVFHNESSIPEVIEVKSGSPAEEGGVKPGDVILALNEIEIETLDDLVEAIHNLAAGEETKLKVLRGLEEARLVMVPRFATVTSAAR